MSDIVDDPLETQARIGALSCEGGPHSPTGGLLRRLADEIERLRAERKGDIDANRGHPAWEDAPKEDILDALRFQGATTKALIAEADALRAEVAACRKDAERLDWLQRHFFERKWDGTIGRKCDWYLVGNYRHVAQRMRGDTFREAIDAALGGEGKDDAA